MSIRAAYAAQGVIPYYETHGATYRNPHESIVHECLDKVIQKHNICLNNVLDLAAGSGEISCHLPLSTNIVAIDPYTQDAYFHRMGKMPLSYSFEQIGCGVIRNHKYDIIICSFALHLIGCSYLPSICYELSMISKKLLIITPHKKPTIKCGWSLLDEFVHNRVRVRLYQSTYNF